ncbi:transcription termination/antitermination NusG family protein [Pelagibius sp. 7325]|uniref:transcription termination/antitermination NusG family protein n=1 Tax=Pelagibius sp. 7325 TaxID=3131994 RepID=UPI0030ECEA2B
MKRWYVAQTQTQAEDRARFNLERQGFTTYLPRYRRERSHARRRETVRALLFPGYIFVEFALESAPWRSINGTFGISHLVCQGLFERMADCDRVVVLLDLLGRAVRVQAPLKAVSTTG